MNDGQRRRARVTGDPQPLNDAVDPRVDCRLDGAARLRPRRRVRSTAGSVRSSSGPATLRSTAPSAERAVRGDAAAAEPVQPVARAGRGAARIPAATAQAPPAATRTARRRHGRHARRRRDTHRAASRRTQQPRDRQPGTARRAERARRAVTPGAGAGTLGTDGPAKHAEAPDVGLPDYATAEQGHHGRQGLPEPGTPAPQATAAKDPRRADPAGTTRSRSRSTSLATGVNAKALADFLSEAEKLMREGKFYVRAGPVRDGRPGRARTTRW